VELPAPLCAGQKNCCTGDDEAGGLGPGHRPSRNSRSTERTVDMARKSSTEIPDRPDTTERSRPSPAWTFLTNHGHVLIAVARNPDMLVQDIADAVGITPRGTLHILGELEEAGYIHRSKSGRRTHYTVEQHRYFRHPSTAHEEIGALLRIFAPVSRDKGPKELTT
jgi:DNA-binding MarR family transcriptional regulator